MRRVFLLHLLLSSLYVCTTTTLYARDEKHAVIPLAVAPVEKMHVTSLAVEPAEENQVTTPIVAPVEKMDTTPLRGEAVEKADVVPTEKAAEKQAVENDMFETPAPALALDENAVPHIALLLPLNSKDYGSAADAVQQGFLAAASYEGNALPIHIYSSYDENTSVVAIYQKAIASGARAVVGPLTRSGVSALAAQQNIPVPTLALNMAEIKPEQQLYYFGMAAESEARQAAQLARQQGLHQAIIITTRAQLTKRLQSAFEEEWFAAGGEILREIEYGNIAGEFADITEIPGAVIFLAADTKNARLIRPYLPNKLPIYATSQIFSGNNNSLINYDLNGIRFVDMPWLLQPDHAAVMIYPQASTALSIDRERLYALGIDAFRLIQLLLSENPVAALPLDGVTGDIYLKDHIFQRSAIPAVFQEGRSQLVGRNVTRPAQNFPDQTLVVP